MINLQDKKILVTGAAGFVGQFLVKNLRDQRLVPEKNLTLPRHADCDLRQWSDCQQVTCGQDIVIHLAAKVGGIGYNQKYPAELFYDNLLLGIQLMEAARQAGVKKFVAIGTICAYPKFTPVPFKESDIWNGYPEETNAAYGLAKKMLLVQAQAYRQQYGFNAIYLLPANMYGPGDDFSEEKSHAIPALIAKIHRAKLDHKPTVTLWGTGQATREFMYVEDAAAGILRAAETYDQPEPLNLGTGVSHSIAETAKIIADLLDYDGQIIWDTSRPDGQPQRNLDITRARQCLNWQAETPLNIGLRETINWYQNNL